MKRLKKIECSSQSKGIFWFTNNGLLAFPYDPNDHPCGLSKNGLTYTHKKLWSEIAGKYRKHPYNYFPRGRVEIDNKGRSVIYMNPNIPDSAIADIRKEFGIRDNEIIKYDNSDHYKCYLDDGWLPDR